MRNFEPVVDLSLPEQFTLPLVWSGKPLSLWCLSLLPKSSLCYGRWCDCNFHSFSNLHSSIVGDITQLLCIICLSLRYSTLYYCFKFYRLRCAIRWIQNSASCHLSLNRKLNFGATVPGRRRGVDTNWYIVLDWCNSWLLLCNIPSLLARLLATVIMLDCC